MADFNIRSDSVNVEEIMQQIRARIREKRGVDYTEQEIRDLAAVKLEKFLDPSKVRSDLLEQYRQLPRERANPYLDVDEDLFGSPRPWLRKVRRLLRPLLKLLVNPGPLERAIRLESVCHAQWEEEQRQLQPLQLFYELIHNMVVETTRLAIEVKNLKMRVESLSSRLDFDERRARALEGTVQYRPGATPAPAGPEGTGPRDEEGGAEAESAVSRSRRRRRRRGRRGQGGTTGPAPAQAAGSGESGAHAGPRIEGEAGPATPEANRDERPGASPEGETQPREAGHGPDTGPGSQEPGT